MITESPRTTILASQLDSGAFPAIAHLPSGPVLDANAFVTSLVVDRLSRIDSDREIAEACQRGVDFLLQCKQPGPVGGFSFYSAHAQPAWIDEFLPPDADDTALCSLALFRAGRWQREDLRRQVLEVLDHHRLPKRPQGAEWFRAGVYPTWLDSRRMHNPIDVCVNVNVAVLVTLSGVIARHVDGIMEMVEAALDWVGVCAERARVIMPYYPHPAEFVYALERAAHVGVRGAGLLLKRLGTQPWNSCEASANSPICSSLGAGIVWTSPVLQVVREWTFKNDDEPARR